MIHLRAYNESAGGLYRQVDDEEFEGHKASQQVDTFTTGEVQALLDMVQLTTRVIQVGLYKVTHVRKFVRELMVYEFDGRDNKSYSYPRTPPNNIYIWDKGLSWQLSMAIDITKSCDDYFYVSVTFHSVDFYICDGVAGLKSLMVDLFEERKS